MITILDVGCRYGIFPLFRDHFDLINYIGVDADLSEIERLRKKYKHHTNLSFYDAHLSMEDSDIEFHLAKHRGYSSTKIINSHSIWFSTARKNEAEIEKTIILRSNKSGPWIDKYIFGNFILKLDIEGGELDFLKGLDEQNYLKLEAVIVEAHFDNPYHTESNFSTIFLELKERGYWLASSNIEGERLNKYSTLNETIPITTTAIFLKNSYRPTKNSLNDQLSLEMIEVLYLLKFYGMVIDGCMKNGYCELSKSDYFHNIKYAVGHRFNFLKKDLHYQYDDLNHAFRFMFNEDLPHLSNFYESDFYNPH